jgi:uncharacterized repeat protein (TIGR01451 family)
MFQSFPRNHSARVLVLALALACFASWATSRTYSHSNPLASHPSNRATASKTFAEYFERDKGVPAISSAALQASTADLAITKTASPSAGTANGSQLTYTITVTNGGPDTATDVNVNDPLPAGTTFFSVTPSQGSCSAPAPGNTGTLNCSLGSVATPGSATITLVVTFTAAPGTAISNTATVASTSTDPNPGNNSATSTTSVAQTFCSPVTTIADSGAGSLRSAIFCANANPGLDAITFNIPGSGVHSIALLSPLPSINSPVFLDGYSQPGSVQNTLLNGDNAVLAIELNGASAEAGFVNGLTINSGGGGSTVSGLVINRFLNHGIFSGASGNRIAGNFIGTNAAGTAALTNARDGIQVNNGSNNTIGGPSAGARNIISGNGVTSPPGPSNGVDLFGTSSSGNVVQNNYIGTDATGTLAVPNLTGVNVNGAANNTIVGNLISGNNQNGVQINTSTATGNSVRGNFIGTTANGSAPLGNNGLGVAVFGTSRNTIGGDVAGARNVISGNRGSGVSISNGSTLNVVQGNLIGTDVNGTTAIPNGLNGQAGVFIFGSLNTIGGSSAAARNIISGNKGIGVRIQQSSSNSILGNYIGTDITGNVGLGNIHRGVMLSGASNNTIAGNVLSGNVGSGNDGAGVTIEDGGTGNQVQGNFIGTNANGTTALGNAQFGVLIDRSSGNTIAMNTVAFNGTGGGGAGVLVGTFDPGSNLSGPSSGNAIHQNSIFSNYGLGIDLSADATFGVTPNDSCDTDSGPNNFQNFPVLNAVSSSGGNTTIQGTLNSTPNTSFTLEFFSNDAADPSGNGEGQTYIGSTSVTTDGTCNASFTVTVPVTVSSSQVISATATDPGGNTSEFSAWSSSTTTTVASNNNPSTYGQAVTFTATVTSGAGTPTGTVTFKDGAATLGTGTLDGSGQATFTSSSLSVSTHSITAVYSGSANYNSSTSEALIQTVNQATTTTTLASDNNPSTYGQPVTFTATVTSSGGTPTGTVTFKDGTTTLGTSSLDGSGQATLTTSSLSAGTHSITAVYNGDSNFSGSTSSTTTQIVNQASTSTSLTSSQNPSTYGQPVTFTATVTSNAGTPTGTVTFKDGTTTLGSSSLDGSGQATLTTSALSAGTHSITAVYNGDSNFSGSTSSATTQTVNQASTTTSLTSSPNPSTYGQPVTFTASVTVGPPGSGTATGTVTFKDGAMVLATVVLNGSGQATYTTSSLFIGTHSITATYSGDANFKGSTSPPLIQTVATPPSTESVKVNGGGSILLTTGGSGTFGLVGMVSKSDVPSGNVEYQDHDTGMNIKSTTITAVVVTGIHAQMFGKATVNGAGSFDFVVDVDDLGEPGTGVDKFRIQLSNGYTAGPALISGGNIQVHN